MTTPKHEYLRSTELVSRHTSRLLLVDVQEKLLPAIPRAEQLVASCKRMIDGANLVGVPVFATEQYPKGLGPTAKPLAELIPLRPEKLRFSCAEVLDWGPAAEQTDSRHQVVVIGMETHVCVLQTSLDLVALGYQVFVPADAVASRSEFDWKFALDRLTNSGVIICTSESVLFEWCEVSGTPEFKQLSQWIKSAPPK